MNEHEWTRAGDEFDPAAAEDAGTERETSGSKSSAEIEREIEQTRARMSERIDTISEKLRPGNLAQSAVESAGEQARRTGSRLANVIRENPIPVAAIGLGVTWLVAQQRSKRGLARYGYRGPERRISGYPERRRGVGTRIGATVGAAREPVGGAGTGVAERAENMTEGLGDVAERAQERMSELGSEARERMQQLGSRARERTQRVGVRLERMIDENPLAVAAGAVVLGLAAGLLLPGTRREDELMGSARDQLVERAGDTVERVKEAAGEAAREVTETVKAEVAERGPEVKDVVQDMTERVTEQAKESAGRVREATKEALKDQTGGTKHAPRRRTD
jgi:ElaB/YqjD/DUF883 family membrane-anchored ribosome-binding protein